MSKTLEVPCLYPDDWESQKRGVTKIEELLARGETRICATQPTGGGKSRMMQRLIEPRYNAGQRGLLLLCRSMLAEQTIEQYAESAWDYGVIWAEYPSEADYDALIQIAMTQTLYSRTFKLRAKKEKAGWTPEKARQKIPLPDVDYIIVDEIQMQKAGMIQAIINEYSERGVPIIGFTATPLGLSHLFPKKNLVVCGTNSELRDCGAHLPCWVYAPWEIDLGSIKRGASGEFSKEEIRKVYHQQIYGKVIDHYERLNPERRPTILFAPGVPESRYFVDEFARRGFNFVHIDGNNVYRDGEDVKGTAEDRKAIINELRTGKIDGITNRFVMRDGIDIPELYHCILATPIGSQLSYVQTVGRVLRYWPQYKRVILQDHGGNWWRHGSPNADREWETYFDLPERIATDHRLEKIRTGEDGEREPICCPQCGVICTPEVWSRNRKCPQCGYQAATRKRPVLQHDGTLKELENARLKPRRVRSKPDTGKLWERMYQRMKRAGKTFSQARGLFCHENGYFPPGGLPRMPLNSLDWHRKVQDVHPDLLVPKPTPDTGSVPGQLFENSVKND